MGSESGRGLKLGALAIEHPTALAPMAALTDTVFRRLVKRQGGCGFVITEMVSAEGLLRRNPQQLELLRFSAEERPVGGQLQGADPDRMAAAAAELEQMGFDFVDVNMGCPSRKIVAGGGGAALPRDLGRTERVLRAMRKAVSIPLTVKLRAGWDEEAVTAPAVARLGEAVGVALVSVHARTRSDRYRELRREDVLAATAAAVEIPVLANGNVRTVHDARALMERTGCAGVMAGRGAVANPWLLRDISARSGEAADPGRSRRWILDHFAILSEELDGRRLLGKLRTFAGWYTRGLLRGAALRQRINELTRPEEFVAAVEEHFAEIEAGARRGDDLGLLAPSHQTHRP